jgi:cysteinyl-tRNA synthetase
MKIYNTLTRKKEPFETIESKKVRMYVCGPTVYDSAHVGHAMSSIVFDVMRRYLEYKGYDVKHVMNYTDVDDKVIRRAIELKVDPVGLAEKYIKQYDEHLQDLNVLPAHVNPRVSEEIEGIIELVKDLEESGFAYEVDGDVYFRVSEDEDYGRLSGRKVEDMQAGFRLEVDVRKEDPADFALWKSAKEGEPSWESPWGDGRPGWHIECSQMALRHLGKQIDIHGGGNDLVFPHHENEIAQTESLTGQPFATYWTHNGMLQIGGEAMSKSVGNMVTVEEFLAKHESDVLRLMVLNASYRAPLTFTDKVIEQSANSLNRLRGGLRPANSDKNETSETFRALKQKTEDVRPIFEEAMNDDFNTPGALSSLFELVRSINQARDSGASNDDLRKPQDILKELAGVLGLALDEKQLKSQDAVPFIELLITIRKDLRQAEQWGLADRVRDGLEELGIIIEDSKAGTTWRHE